MKNILSKFKPGWPAVVLGCVVILCVTAILIFAPANIQDKTLEALGWAAYIGSQLLGPIVQRKAPVKKPKPIWAPLPPALPTEKSTESHE